MPETSTVHCFLSEDLVYFKQLVQQNNHKYNTNFLHLLGLHRIGFKVYIKERV